MPSAPSRMAASKLASVFSGYMAEACRRRVDWVTALSTLGYVHRDDPNILSHGLNDKSSQRQRSTYQVRLQVSLVTYVLC